jgi:hypothetical protein
MAWTADDIAQLRRHWNDGRTCKEIAILLGKTKNAVIGAVRRNGLERRPSPLSDEGRRRYQGASQHQNTSPSAARPSRTAVAACPHDSNPAHAGGDVASSGAGGASEGDGLDSHRQASPADVKPPLSNSPAGTPKPAGASSGKNASAGKAKGGRMSARSARSYYATFGGRRGDHEHAKHAAAQSRAPGTCMACDRGADIDASGLCVSCASIVQRADAPAAAYGGEPGNLSRVSGGTEADNIVTSG